MDLRIHVGLHKTGTTSFQRACFAAREELRKDGILYPVSDALNEGNSHHSHVASTLMSDGPDASIDLVWNAVREFPECRTVLLSSEEFSNVLGASAFRQASEAFVRGLAQRFDSVRYLCVIRNEFDYLRSALREYFEGVGLPVNAPDIIKEQVVFHLDKPANLLAVLGNNLDVAEYESLDEKYFCTSILDLAVISEVILETYRLNSTKRKDARSLIGGLIRNFYYNYHRSISHYSPTVQREYEHILGGISFEPEVNDKLIFEFDKWLCTVIEQLPEYQNHVKFRETFQSNLVQISHCDHVSQSAG